MIIKYFYISSSSLKNFKNKKNVLIYGAGNAGRQLLTNLENNSEMKVVGFLDDNPEFQGQTILGQVVFETLKIDKLIFKKKYRRSFIGSSINYQTKKKSNN